MATVREAKAGSKPGQGSGERGAEPGYVAGLAAGSLLLESVVGLGGVVDVDHVARVFHMSRAQLAETAGLGYAAVSKADRRVAPRAQTRLVEMLEILNRVVGWAGGQTQAMAWYRSQPIPALDGRTAEALVKSGRAGAVREYLDHFALGGFA